MIKINTQVKNNNVNIQQLKISFLKIIEHQGILKLKGTADETTENEGTPETGKITMRAVTDQIVVACPEVTSTKKGNNDIQQLQINFYRNWKRWKQPNLMSGENSNGLGIPTLKNIYAAAVSLGWVSKGIFPDDLKPLIKTIVGSKNNREKNSQQIENAKWIIKLDQFKKELKMSTERIDVFYKNEISKLNKKFQKLY